MEKTIKYLENGEYHYATVRSVGDLAELKTNSKETLVEAINELWNGGGNADPSKAPKPEGYDQLVEDVADAVKNQQEINQQWTEWQKEDAQLTEERKQAYLQAMKEMQESIDKAKADAAALDKKLQEGVDTLNNKTSKLDEQITKTFSDLDTNIQNMHEQLQKEADSMNQELINTKSDLTKVRTDLQNAQLDNGRIHDELTNINGKFEHKVWQTDLDPLKEQIDRAETSVQQTKDELLGKASRQDLDTVTNTVSKLDTQLKETAKGVEISVKKDELGGDVARLLNDKTNLLLGTRSFSGEDNWENRDTATIEPGYYKGLKSAAIQSTDSSIYQPYHIKANTAYTFSFFGKEDKDNPKATLIIKPIDAPNINIDNAEQPVHITTEWQRFAVTFSADQDCDISIQIIQGPEASNNILHLAGFKLQYGQNNTPWEPNEADVAENIEHNESQFNVYSDQIAGIVKKQEKMGDTERQLDTRITETAEGLKQTSKDLQDANGKITEFKGQLESTARGLKTEYEKYTNDAIGQISDSSLNLIRNSAFQNKDDNFAQWQNVSAKANIREDGNGLRWVELTQSGMTTDNPQGVTSNYFVIKQGKVTVAVDIKLGDKANLDNQNILLLELYNDNKQRVDFTDVSVSQLGLSMAILNDHNVHRGLYRLGIDRKDVKYMTVKAILHRNGDLWFTNFSARLSSIDDGGYTPNPDDLSQQILKMNTKIEEDAEHIALKANSVDVTRDIKSAVDGIRVGGRNLANGTDKEYTMGYGIPNTTWQNGYAYESLPTKILAGEILPQNDQFYANLVPGQEYTQTIWFETDADVKKLNAAITWFASAGHDEQPAKIIKVGENSYKLFSTYTWPGKTGNNVRLFDIFYLQDAFDLSTGTYIKFGKLKLEEGNVSTDWTPALQDTSEEIKSAKDAAIQVASDQINIHVNELSTSFDDKLNKRVNEVKTASEKFTSDGIELTVEKITDVKNQVDGVNDRVNNLKVGTSNLLHHSDTFDGWYKGASISTATDKYLNGTIATLHSGGSGSNSLEGQLDGPYDDQPVTWTVYAKADNAGDQLHTELWGGGGFTNQPLTTDWKLYKFSGHRDSRDHSFYLWGWQGNKGNVYVALPFAVVGNAIGTWTPNPDDVDSKFQYKEVTGAIDFNDLKTQQKIFYKDVHAQNAPAGSNYWYFLNVDVVPGTARIVQTATSDRDNITWKRTFADSWTAWQKQATQGDVDALRTETTASVQNLGDRVTTEVNSVTTKINNIQVGGRNYLRNSDKSTTGFGQDLGTMPNEVLNSLAGKTITVSADVEWSNFVSASDVQNRLGFEMSVHRSDGKDQWFGAWVSPTTPNGKERVSTTFDVPAGLTYTVSNNGQNGYVSIKGTGTVSHAKIEIGNKPTDWSPAPEDTAEAIKTLNTKWDVANGQIQGKVTATDVNNILNGKGYATQSWAQTMFTMKSDAITLQAVRDNITNGIQNQVNDAKSQINSANGRIDETNEKIDKAKIGERNLAVGTNRGRTGWTVSPGNGQSTMDDSWVNDVMGVIFNNTNKSTSWWVVQYPFDMGRLKPNTFYTISFDIQTDIKTNGDGYLAFARGDSSGSPFVNSTSLKIITEPGATTHVVCKAKTKGSIENNGQAFYLNSNSLGQANWVKIFNLMIVEGTQSIAWAAAPEDEDVKQKGVNLLKSTAYWNPADWNHISDGQWYDDNWTDNLGHKAYGHHTAWQGLGQTVYVTPGVYTWSAQIYLNGLDSNDYVYPYMGDSRYNGTVQVQDIRKPMLGVNDQNKWINYSATFYVKNAGNLCVHPELNRDHGTIHVGSQKLEHGMVATPWSPSPLDDKNATITLDSADVNNMKTQGHYFVRNLANSPIAGWVYVDVTGNNNDRLKQEVYQDNGYEHRSRRWTGSGWTEWTTDVNNKNVISQINITPDQIKIASNKIVIDGNTDIHGVLRVPDVKLAGRNGNVDLSGDGINITKTNGAGINIASNGIQLTANTNGQNEIEGVITTAWSMNNKNQNGIGLILTTEQELGRPYGGDILAIGSMPSLGKIHAGMVFDATGITPEYKKGFNWFAPHTLNGDGGVLRFPGAQDDLMLYPGNMPGSRQSNYSQPTLRLVNGNRQGSAGIQFQWDDIVPFGRIETSHSVMTPVYPQGDETNAGLAIGWVSWFGNSGYTQGRMPMIHRVNGNMHVNAGFAFFPDGNVVYWNGSKRANLTWAFAKYDPYYEPDFGGF